MIIEEHSVVTIYTDAMAIIMMCGLLFLSERNKKNTTENRLFSAMCYFTIINAFFGGISYAMKGNMAGWTMIVELISKTVVELSLLIINFQWLLFVDYKVNGSRDHLYRKYKKYSYLIFAFVILLFVNLYTGIMFTITPGNDYRATFLYYLMEAVEYLFFLLSVIIVIIYRRSHRGLYYFRILPLVTPIVFCEIISQLSSFSLTSIGIAIGLVNLYFSMMNVWQYEDSELGCFNRNYFVRLKAYAKENHREYKGLIIFETKGNEKKLAYILNNELPKNNDLIHYTKGVFVFFIEQGKQDFLEMIRDNVIDAVEIHNRENNDHLEMNCRISMKKNNLFSINNKNKLRLLGG
ncbi:MAG: hypothetical protein K6F99_01640 [Lachnospiraceae bacterium]|nr:hypothetical protein [Lachnospiraceae bacterium]